MNVLTRLAEQRIAEAIERGELDRLPGAGRPLELGDDAGVPPELRVAYRMLRNAGYLPPELELARAIRAARQRLTAAVTAPERAAAARRLDGLRLQLENWRGRPLSPALEAAYGEQLLDRLDSDGTTGRQDN